MRKHFTLSLLFITFFTVLFCTNCHAENKNLFTDSEWIMNNYDGEGNPYYHHLILQQKNKVILRVSYFESTNIIVWQGTYKINSKKITFKFDRCERYENGQLFGNYQDGRFIKYYNGEYLYSVGLIDDELENKKNYHMQLIRPKNQIYGETKDIFGNYFEEFERIEKLINK